MSENQENQTIDVDELVKSQESDRPVQFWNVLTDDYYTGELIPGSRRVPLDGIDEEVTSLSKDTDIVVYCSGPTCPTSAAAGKKLSDLGFTNVRVFKGGLEEWKGAGHPVEKHDHAGV